MRTNVRITSGTNGIMTVHAEWIVAPGDNKKIRHIILELGRYATEEPMTEFKLWTRGDNTDWHRFDGDMTDLYSGKTGVQTMSKSTKTTEIFQTLETAAAFKAGVEFVNDSAITVGEPKKTKTGWTLEIRDADGRGE